VLLLLENLIQLLLEEGCIDEVDYADPGAASLVFIGGVDAAARRPDPIRSVSLA
jgi:hypothetical protein